MKINKGNAKKETEFKYNVIEECGTVSARKGGYSLKLRYMSWNDNNPVYDLRCWKIDENGNEICGKGITISGEELEALMKILNS